MDCKYRKKEEVDKIMKMKQTFALLCAGAMVITGSAFPVNVQDRRHVAGGAGKGAAGPARAQDQPRRQRQRRRCRCADHRPDLTVLVVTLQALKMHGGVAQEDIKKPNIALFFSHCKDTDFILIYKHFQEKFLRK